MNLQVGCGVLGFGLKGFEFRVSGVGFKGFVRPKKAKSQSGFVKGFGKRI